MTTYHPEPDRTVTDDPNDLESVERDESEETAEQSATSPPPDSPNRWWIVVLIIALLAGGGGFAGWQWWQSRQQSGQEQAGPPPTAVEAETIEPRTVEDTSDFVGTLEAEQTAQLRSEASGEIVEIYVQSGDRIAQGETLAQLDRRAAEASLARAEADVSRANARLAELQAGTRDEQIAQARARLRQAEADLRDARSGASPAEVAQARARLESARATVELTSRRLDRFGTLEARGAVPTDELDGVRERARTAQANLEEARRELEELQETQDTEVNRLAAEVEERREALRELENGARPEEIAQAQADLEAAVADVRAAEVTLQDTEIVAPFSGTVGDIPVKVGDYLGLSDVFATLTQNDRLNLQLSVPLERSDDLRLGQPVEIYDPSGEAEDPLALGRIRFIAPQVSSDSQTLMVEASFENPQGRLRDRQFVRARIIWEERPGGVLIPTTAITFQGQRRFVFVVNGSEGNLSVERRQVELGLSQGDRTEVVEGLEPGDRIVTSGLQKLRDGQPVTLGGGAPGGAPSGESSGN